MTFPSPSTRTRQEVRISSDSNRVRVIAEARDATEVEGRATVRHEGDRTTVDDVSTKLVVRVPIGSDVVVGTASARVDIVGDVGGVAIVTESGRITVERADSVDARTASARIVVGHAANACRVRSESGKVSIGGCGGADVATTSGRIELDSARGPVTAHCVSGRIEIGLAAAYDVEAETVSGRIEVTVPAGVHAAQVTESARAGRDEDADCTIFTRSVSGRVVVRTR